MAQTQQTHESAGEADSLGLLRERLERTQEAAQRLAEEAASAAARAATSRKPPETGWQAPRPDGAGDSADLHGLLTLGHLVRGLVPQELQEQLAAVVRELLLALRALIDWYLDRVEARRRTAPVEVQDIPIV
jgi:hypothetical protein